MFLQIQLNMEIEKGSKLNRAASVSRSESILLQYKTSGHPEDVIKKQSKATSWNYPLSPRIRLDNPTWYPEGEGHYTQKQWSNPR